MKIGKLYHLMYGIQLYNSAPISSNSYLFMAEKGDVMLILKEIKAEECDVIKILTKEGIICWSQFLYRNGSEYYFKLLEQ